jgi:hypothetical protein
VIGLEILDQPADPNAAGAAGAAGDGSGGTGGQEPGGGGTGGTEAGAGMGGTGGDSQAGAGGAGGQGGMETGGAGQSQGGAGQSQGGAGQSQGGAGQSQGGAGQNQGGAGQSQGGAGSGQGGAGQSQGGAGQNQGGAGQSQGGAGSGQGGAGQNQGGAGQSGMCQPGGSSVTGAYKDAVGQPQDSCPAAKPLPTRNYPVTIPCCTLYVDNKTSSDGNGTPDAPIKDLPGALASASDGDTICLRATDTPYSGGNDPLKLDKAVSLLGGFDKNWLRPTTYPFVSEDPQKIQTRIVASLPGPLDNKQTALTVTYAGATGMLIDGIVFPEPQGNANVASVGVEMQGVSANLTFSNNIVQAGNGLPGTFPHGSVGILLSDSSPTIQLSQIKALGDAYGQSMDPNSVGIAILHDSHPRLQGNKINGGSGLNNNGIGSAGILVDSISTSATQITDNEIDGGTGGVTVGINHVGVQIIGASVVDLSNNYISAGGDGVKAASGQSVGVLYGSTAALSIQMNRIYGGAGGNLSQTTGIQVVSGSGGQITGNMIHGGRADQKGIANSYGVWLSGNAIGLLISYNTIASGYQSIIDQKKSTALILSKGSSTRVEANLLLANEPTSLAFDLAKESTLSFVGNVILGTGTTLGNNGGAPVISLATLSSPSSPNFVLGGSCSEMGCLQTAACNMNATPACLLGCWGSDGGLAALQSVGWQFKETTEANISCPVLGKYGNMMPSFSSQPTKDLYDTLRPGTGMMTGDTTGAAQYKDTMTMCHM